MDLDEDQRYMMFFSSVYEGVILVKECECNESRISYGASLVKISSETFTFNDISSLIIMGPS